MTATASALGTTVAAPPIRSVSVMIPMRNEEAHVRQLIEDLAAQDYGGRVEILVADGGSTDGSVAVLEDAAAAAGLDLRVLPNPAGTVAPGLNACIAEARGDLIVRLDAHSRYPTDYIRRCVEASEETGADNVGGIYSAWGRTRFEEVVATALASPFGGVNWTRDAKSDGRVEADTVYCGAFRPAIFEAAGAYDERLVRNQDDELNLRIRRAGGTIVFDPRITATYTPRGSLRSVFRQYYEYGFWKVAVLRKHRTIGSARSLAPIAFVTGTAALAVAARWSPAARRLLAAQSLAYGAAATAFGVGALRSRGEPLRRLPHLLLVFAAFHVGYGSGFLSGAAALLRPARRPPRP